MKNMKRKLLGFPVDVAGMAETVQEAIDATGDEDYALRLLNQQQFVSHYGVLRKIIVQQIELLTSHKSKKGESPMDYLRRVRALTETDLSEFNEKIYRATGTVPINYQPRFRDPNNMPVQRPSQKWLQMADELSDKKLESFCEKAKISRDKYNDREAFLKAVAIGLREHFKAKNKDILDNL